MPQQVPSQIGGYRILGSRHVETTALHVDQKAGTLGIAAAW